jgi:uncharacterized DUF497 family protein
VNASSFFNRPLVAGDDERRSQAEKRFLCSAGQIFKKIFLSFSRSKNNLIRVISAGDMSRKEREVYSNEEADTGFQNEAEEREFRAVHDSTEYIDWNRSEQVTFFNLKPSVRKISLRLPESMLEEPNCRPTKGMSRISC